MADTMPVLQTNGDVLILSLTQAAHHHQAEKQTQFMKTLIAAAVTLTGPVIIAPTMMGAPLDMRTSGLDAVRGHSTHCQRTPDTRYIPCKAR